MRVYEQVIRSVGIMNNVFLVVFLVSQIMPKPLSFSTTKVQDLLPTRPQKPTQVRF